MRNRGVVKIGVQTLLVFILSLLIWSCGGKRGSEGDKTQPESNKIEMEVMSEGKTLLAKVLKAHGGDKYGSAHFQFVFRENDYTFKNDGVHFEYRKTFKKDGKEIIDRYSDKLFERHVEGELVDLSDKEKSAYSNSLNSVIYFATLPHKLLDPAVNIQFIGNTEMKGQGYEMLSVTFGQEGGGKDHDDEYLYWINSDSKRIDFLAYNYTVNNGGVRFRSAYNTRNIDGIIFQDYVNYKVVVGAPLKELLGLFAMDKLEKLSVIETEKVINLKK
ncbi:MAG: hypothetical protein ACJAZG_002016 [Granulosicoccus sp.]|jgi:hypothetical protein